MQPAARLAFRSGEVSPAPNTTILDRLNKHTTLLLNAMREAIGRLERADEVQFARTAQLQAELDAVTRALERPKAS